MERPQQILRPTHSIINDIPRIHKSDGITTIFFDLLTGELKIQMEETEANHYLEDLRRKKPKRFFSYMAHEEVRALKGWGSQEENYQGPKIETTTMVYNFDKEKLLKERSLSNDDFLKLKRYRHLINSEDDRKKNVDEFFELSEFVGALDL